MAVRRELLVGLLAFAVFATTAISIGQTSADPTIRSFSLLVAVGAGGGMSVFVAAAYHLSRGPRGARYEPVPGDAGAWGLAEMEDYGSDERAPAEATSSETGEPGANVKENVAPFPGALSAQIRPP